MYGIWFCGMMYIEGAYDGLWSRLASDVISCIVNYWELLQVVLCADCAVRWRNHNFICIFVPITLKMVTWVAESCRWSLCKKITSMNPSVFLVFLINFMHYEARIHIYIYIYIYIRIAFISSYLILGLK